MASAMGMWRMGVKGYAESRHMRRMSGAAAWPQSLGSRFGMSGAESLPRINLSVFMQDLNAQHTASIGSLRNCARSSVGLLGVAAVMKAVKLSLALSLFAANSLAAQGSLLDAVPADIRILRVQWAMASIAPMLCIRSHAELTNQFSSAKDNYQAEIRKAESRIRLDAEARGAVGDRYLKAFIVEHEQGVEGDLNVDNAPAPTKEECSGLANVLGRVNADTLFASWVRFVRRIESKSGDQVKDAK